MHYTPLRYPGGKTKLFKYVDRLLECNNLYGCDYAEPFAGGAGIAVSLLIEGKVNRIYINDFSKSIYCFWDALVSQTDELCALIYDTPVTIESWKKQKKILQTNEESLELGFAAFFLNRTNRSGILNGGMIGGFKQQGAYKIDARYNKDTLIKRIQKIAKKKDQITVTNYECFSFMDYIKKSGKLKNEKILVYFDPPYVINGKRLYENYYEMNDHKALAKKLIEDVEYPWFLTYDKTDMIKEWYNGLTMKTFKIDYSANIHRKGMEMMICNKQLKLPTQMTLNENNINMLYC